MLRDLSDQTREREQRLDDVVGGYLQALASGRTPNSDELLTRHPDLAPDLAQFLADLEAVGRMAAPLRQTRAPSSPGEPSTRYTLTAEESGKTGGRAGPVEPAVLGDYELLQEIGRGGMGVVYRARHRVLGRLDAIKMLRPEAWAGAEAPARFRNEARATSRLHHPNIVQIHQVGEQDGRPYLVLELVEGGNLAEHLSGNPITAAEAARLVETLARAVHAAHECGIVHRDLKPANILLQKVEGGPGDEDQTQEATPGPGGLMRLDRFVPKITDFGLAKELAQPRERQTLSGAIVGTASYMAPEQAEGRTKDVGPKTDVYALGVLLYELLTGRPPFKGAAPLDTLKQLIADPPIPPRRLQPAVPRDLETVCLKCLEKDPPRRYGSALALAEDLRRFLAGEPVRARPVGLAGRLWRWSRRQPLAAGLCAALALSVVTGFAAVTAAWLQAEAHFQESERQRGRAEANFIRAEKYLAEAKQQRAEAQAMFAMAHGAVKDILVPLSENKLAHLPGAQPLRKNVLEKVRAYYDEFLKRHAGDPALRTELADTYFRLGLINTAVGAKQQALASYRQALALYEELRRADPGNSWILAQQAHVHNNTGFLRDGLGQGLRALDAFRQARKLHEQRLQAHPNDPGAQNDLSITLSNLGAMYGRMGRSGQALDCLERARALQEQLTRTWPDDPIYRSQLATTVHNIGAQLEHLTRPKECMACFQEALAMREDLARRYPRVLTFQSRLAESYRCVGDRLRAQGETKKALEALGRGQDILERLVRDNPSVPAYRKLMSVNLEKIGRTHMDARPGQPAQALLALDRARAIDDRLARQYPNEPSHLSQLGWHLYHMAHCHYELKQRDRELRCHEQAREAVLRLVKLRPYELTYRKQLGFVANDLGVTYWQLGRPGPGRQALQQAIEQYSLAMEQSPRPDDCRSYLDLAYRNLAGLEREQGRLDESAAITGRRHKLWPADAGRLYTVAQDYAQTAALAGKGQSQPSAEDAASRRRCTDLALAALRQAVAAGFNDVQQLRGDRALDALRTHDGFRQLLAELENKGRP
jgi:tetratricopeptide (TPR) repeat protein